MKLTSLFELVSNLQQAGKMNNADLAQQAGKMNKSMAFLVVYINFKTNKPTQRTVGC